MARTEWLRTFVVAYQLGSVTDAARARHISQPSATSHLGSLESLVGSRLFTRTRIGVTPTAEGKRLYSQVADPLERLAQVFEGLDVGRLELPESPLRVGSNHEVFAGLVVPKLSEFHAQVNAVFGSDEELHSQLVTKDIDLAITTASPVRKSLSHRQIAEYRYAIVLPQGERRSFVSLHQLGEHLRGHPWVSYSSDFPKTRAFWKRSLGRPFDADLKMVAPDLRVVLSAVEEGIGASMLPKLICQSAIERGTAVEPFPVEPLVEPKPLFAVVRKEEEGEGPVAELVSLLAGVSQA